MTEDDAHDAEILFKGKGLARILDFFKVIRHYPVREITIRQRIVIRGEFDSCNNLEGFTFQILDPKIIDPEKPEVFGATAEIRATLDGFVELARNLKRYEWNELKAIDDACATQLQVITPSV